MSKGIRLSEKHGVNPSLIKCFYCGEHKGIALLGRLKNDEEAPREIIPDYEPCDECAKQFAQGVTLIEATETQPMDKRPHIKAKGDVKVYPTGRVIVMTEDAVLRVFNVEAKKGDKIFLQSEVFEELAKSVEE